MRAQLIETRERQIHLPFDARCPLNAKVVCFLRGVLEQGRLSDSRLAVDHKRSALAPADGIDQLVEHIALGGAPEQHLVTESTPLSGVRQGDRLPPNLRRADKGTD